MNQSLKKIFLVVDDSPLIRKIAKQILQKNGFDVIEAENGKSALEMCKKFNPLGVLLDWEMPVLNGIEFLKQVNKADLNPNPKIIFCTSQNSFENIQKALEYGADEYIMKPFDESLIIQKLIQVGLISETSEFLE